MCHWGLGFEVSKAQVRPSGSTLSLSLPAAELLILKSYNVERNIVVPSSLITGPEQSTHTQTTFWTGPKAPWTHELSHSLRNSQVPITFPEKNLNLDDSVWWKENLFLDKVHSDQQIQITNQPANNKCIPTKTAVWTITHPRKLTWGRKQLKESESWC